MQHAPNQQRAGSRALLATSNSSLCAYAFGNCDLNADYITSLGTPSTDSQKLLAYTSILSYNCSLKTSKTSCTGNCEWVSTGSSGVCVISDSYFDLAWLRGKAYCAGSNMDTAITCSAYATQSACGSGCTWLSASAMSTSIAATFASSFAELLGGSSGSTNATGICLPNWMNDQNYVASLVSKITNAMSATSGITSYLGAIFDDMFGTCSGVSSFKNMVMSCPAFKNATACRAAAGCEWLGSTSSSGICDLSENAFGTDLLLDPNDPWVKQYNNATTTCNSKTTAAACNGAGAIQVDTAVYTSASYLSTAQPSFFKDGGAAGMASVSSLVSLMAAGLFALFFVL
ncbi:hypothetical protein HYH02_008012 [Chlamydomonas schloesseri]|uniref:Uncharacterized protein n=1 Tax=Chlamydomonas schloesseri TaxID=2026947 RepID=A0A836B3T2_9CHLO|nr:hypothetical protein HYH02_008012 [Chlamydomonas schloesseri]|eukprot:KAG2446855.1 hypothetical protein HYH02_008012 [Chlamydomonas schloesseri]